MVNIIKKLVPRNKHFAIGVSGGSDSLSSLLYFRNRGYNISCWHINNHLIDQDELAEKSVREFCEKHLIPCSVYSCVNKYQKGSKEAFCREERHLGFAELSKISNIKDLVLAHTLTDAKTSYLFDCLRGFTNRQPIPLITKFVNYTVYRPFLLTTKKQLSDYLMGNFAWKYVVEDELNSDLTLTRNFLNKQVIPLIESKRHLQLDKIVSKRIREKIKEF
jgi:tRNA(Ile)-lysidine synthase